MMPLPDTSDVGAIIRELKTAKKKRSKKQMLAIALSHARKNGNKG
jgi:hypothetical protein